MARGNADDGLDFTFDSRDAEALYNVLGTANFSYVLRFALRACFARPENVVLTMSSPPPPPHSTLDAGTRTLSAGARRAPGARSLCRTTPTSS